MLTLAVKPKAPPSGNLCQAGTHALLIFSVLIDAIRFGVIKRICGHVGSFPSRIRTKNRCRHAPIDRRNSGPSQCPISQKYQARPQRSSATLEWPLSLMVPEKSQKGWATFFPRTKRYGDTNPSPSWLANLRQLGDSENPQPKPTPKKQRRASIGLRCKTIRRLPICNQSGSGYWSSGSGSYPQSVMLHPNCIDQMGDGRFVLRNTSGLKEKTFNHFVDFFLGLQAVASE